MLSTQNAMKCNKLRRSNRTKAPRKWIYSISCKKEQQTAQWIRGGREGSFGTHGRSRITRDPRMPTMSGRNTLGFHRPGRPCLHQAQSAVGCWASRMKGELHPTRNRLWGGLSCVWMTASRGGGGVEGRGWKPPTSPVPVRCNAHTTRAVSCTTAHTSWSSSPARCNAHTTATALLLTPARGIVFEHPMYVSGMIRCSRVGTAPA